jgi:hypothetical protein
MIRGGNPRLSNKFMQSRAVILQAVARWPCWLLMLLAGNR